jgi:protein O-GlcNAc transferase
MPSPQELYARATQLHRSGEPAAAIPLYRELLRVAPKEVELHHQLGNALKSLLRFEEAIEPLVKAAKLAPNDGTIRLNLGVAQLELRRFADAEINFRRAITLEPVRPEAHNILGNALFSQGRLAEAGVCFHEALRLRADYAPAHDNLGRLARAQGRIEDAVAHYRAALALQPKPGTHSNLLLALNYIDGVSPQEIFAEHQRWAALYAEPLTAVAAKPPREPMEGRRVRVGYVSPDFSNHAVAYFFEPVLNTHDRSTFEVFCYANVPAPDAVTERLRATAEHWRDIAPLNDEQAAALIRNDHLDLLVDLSGHTARNRLLVFARRAAPVQITWIGYPNTTGLSAIDCRLTDAVSDPLGKTEALHTEELVRLPGPFSVYQPPADAPPMSPLPSLTSAVTFGCFNNFAKVTPAMIALWSRLLTAIPEAGLVLKSRGLGDPETTTRIHGRFEQHGVNKDRIILDGRELSVPAHLALYHQVDIALDTFPYNGTTTTCEALWMGVPVITLAGEMHVARVGASLLTHLGASEWIAADRDAYLEKALALALDKTRLAQIRVDLRERMRASPLCDAVSFTRGLEATYRELISQR